MTQVWDGTVWRAVPTNVWDGSAWASAPLQVWDGTTWRTLGGVTPPTWSPLELPGLVAFWDAADTATITASGGVVSALADKSGNGCTQTTAAGAPTTGTTIKGHNVITFPTGGAEHALTTVDLPVLLAVNQPFTMLCAYRKAGQGRLIETGGGGGGARVLYDATGRYFYAGSAVVNGTPGVNTVEQAVVIFDGPASRFYINGTLDGAGNPGASGLGAYVRLGSYPGGGADLVYEGSLGEAVIVAGSISDSDRASWDSYCLSRWL